MTKEGRHRIFCLESRKIFGNFVGKIEIFCPDSQPPDFKFFVSSRFQTRWTPLRWRMVIPGAWTMEHSFKPRFKHRQSSWMRPQQILGLPVPRSCSYRCLTFPESANDKFIKPHLITCFVYFCLIIVCLNDLELYNEKSLENLMLTDHAWFYNSRPRPRAGKT